MSPSRLRSAYFPFGNTRVASCLHLHCYRLDYELDTPLARKLLQAVLKQPYVTVGSVLVASLPDLEQPSTILIQPKGKDYEGYDVREVWQVLLNNVEPLVRANYARATLRAADSLQI